MMQVLFGGSFDPVHHGHLALARYLRDSGAEVRMIVSAHPPYRNRPIASLAHRRAMLDIALEGEDGIRASESLSVTESPYTVDVLRRVRDGVGREVPLAWAMGSDQFCQLDTWREWRSLTGLAHLVVFERRGETGAPCAEVACHLKTCGREFGELFDSPSGYVAQVSPNLPKVSSTEVRERLAMQGDASPLVPRPVLDYIGKQRQYAGSDGLKS